MNVDGSRTPKFRIDGGWLVEEVDEHTCGTGRDGYFGHHEPGCGLEAICTLAELPAVLTAGFAALEAARDEGATVEGSSDAH